MSQCHCYGITAEPDCPVHGREEQTENRKDEAFPCVVCGKPVLDIRRWFYCSEPCKAVEMSARRAAPASPEGEP